MTPAALKMDNELLLLGIVVLLLALSRRTPGFAAVGFSQLIGKLLNLFLFTNINKSGRAVYNNAP